MTSAAARLAFLAVSVVHLIGHLVTSGGLVTQVTQVLAMPALAACLLTAVPGAPSRLVRLTVVALFFSWLGDTLPRFLDGDAGFLSMVGMFLLAQAAYCWAFWPLRARSLLHRPAAVVPYLVAAVALVGVCAAGAGPLLPAVVVYAAALGAMAVLATGLGAAAGVGGVLFLVSDALIALGAFADLDLPAAGFWVMATYLAAQALLVLGVVGATRGDALGVTAERPLASEHA